MPNSIKEDVVISKLFDVMANKSQKKVLITGATGFIGRYIVEQALQSGYLVFLAVRKESDTTGIDHLKVKKILVDFSSEESIDASLSFSLVFDTVIHNAGVKKCLDQNQFYKYNTELTKNLCNVLSKKKVLKGKFIYISSLAALGPGDEATFKEITEAKEQKPISHYGQSKLLAEKEVLKSGLNYVILRPTAVYGKGTTDYDYLIKAIKKGWAIYMAKPCQRLSFVHAEDLAKIVFVADRVVNGNQIFNVSDGTDYTLESFYEFLANSLEVKIRYRLRVPLFAVMAIARFNQLLERVFKIESALSSVHKAKEVTALNWRCYARKQITEIGFCASHSLKEIIE